MWTYCYALYLVMFYTFSLTSYTTLDSILLTQHNGKYVIFASVIHSPRPNLSQIHNMSPKMHRGSDDVSVQCYLLLAEQVDAVQFLSVPSVVCFQHAYL